MVINYYNRMAIASCFNSGNEMISKHLKDIKKLLKAYHKKYDCFGKQIKKPTKKKKND